MAERMKKRLVLGILAHVDAGKTSLSEAMLYHSGNLRRLGRVDHRDAFLDTDTQERERGITIFSKQAEFQWKELSLSLLDTPGHADLSSEMERTLQVLDCAILVISAADGIQSHTRTLWKLLARYRTPVFLFVNKMDQPGTEKEKLLKELQTRLSPDCADMADPAWMEQAATGSEEALFAFLETGEVPAELAAELIKERKLFPCYFGSALKLFGVEELLDGLLRYGPKRTWPGEFSARIYKIGRDPQGARLSYLKITGGSLRVKTAFLNEETGKEEKINQIRLYSGSKYQLLEEAEAGQVCAVSGLSFTRSGDGLGAEKETAEAPVLQPVLNYQLLFPKETDLNGALVKLRQLEEEDPQLHVVWNENLRQIHVQLMGEVQMEVLQRQLLDRFGLKADFGEGGILYRETIENTVEGVGHYEPLKHYAEVHLLLEPLSRGSGLVFAADCSEEVLDRSYQRLVLTHLFEKIHRGVLTGAPITDMKITLKSGKSHLKHTEGGDFRQATYRAVRQGLMEAKSLLLEPWYSFRMELPQNNLGRAMADVERMGGSMEPPENEGDMAVLTGSFPVSEGRQYQKELNAYSRGQGRIFVSFSGYAPCRDQEKLVERIAYDPEGDLDNSPDSVFCEHGGGFNVKWDRVKDCMHLPSILEKKRAEGPSSLPGRSIKTQATDKELQAIFEKTYGPIKSGDSLLYRPMEGKRPEVYLPPKEEGPEYLLVDGYNILYAWEDLKAVARENLDAARQLLMDLLSNYQGFKGNTVILVFDAYKVKGNPGAVEKYHNIDVVYTKEAETADAYIEKASYELAKNYRVRVATSDGMEQLIILGHGALRIPARAFREEVESVSGQIRTMIERCNRKRESGLVEAAMEKARKAQTGGKEN